MQRSWWTNIITFDPHLAMVTHGKEKNAKNTVIEHYLLDEVRLSEQFCYIRQQRFV